MKWKYQIREWKARLLVAIVASASFLSLYDKVVCEDLARFDILPIGELSPTFAEKTRFGSIIELLKKGKTDPKHWTRSAIFGGATEEGEFVLLVFEKLDDDSIPISKKKIMVELVHRGKAKTSVTRSVTSIVPKGSAYNDCFYRFLETNRQMLLRANNDARGYALGVEKPYFMIQVGPMAGESPGRVPKNSTMGHLLTLWLTIVNQVASERPIDIGVDSEFYHIHEELAKSIDEPEGGYTIIVKDYLKHPYNYSNVTEFIEIDSMVKIFKGHGSK